MRIVALPTFAEGFVEMVGDRPAPGDVAPRDPLAVAPSPEALYRANLPLIGSVIGLIAHRQHLTGTERQEFTNEVHLKLIEDDYMVFRQFKQGSSLKTYLLSVIQNLFFDFRNKLWGKWRNSAEARRLGPVAKRLEQFVCRDGLTFDEAVNVLQTNEGVTLSRDELYAILQRLPVRSPRRFMSEDSVENMSAQGATMEDALLAREQADAARRARQALSDALATLPTQDQLIIKLYYMDHMTIADIARLLKLEQKPLYRRLSTIRRALRTKLEQQGIKPEDLFGRPFEDDEDGE